jgi:hypothetical protein
MLLIPAMSWAGKIQNDFDAGTKFSNYTTYAWRESPPTSHHDLIVRTVDAELSAKFLRRVQANPDLYLVYHASMDPLTFNMSEHGYSYGPQWQWGGSLKTDGAVQTYPQATLVIDLWDAKTQRLIWRGVATDIVGKEPGKVTQEIQKMFLKYPPLNR